MIYLLISILCSVTVGVLFKLAKRYEIHLFQAITWNYLIAIILSLVFLSPEISTNLLEKISTIHIVLGLLLPSLFLILALAVRYAGLARTDIAQRLSLLISLSAAFVLFKEQFDQYKVIGFVFGIVAIYMIMYKKTSIESTYKSTLFLLLVFLGFGTVDILFKKIAQQINIPYHTSLFIIYAIAFISSLCYLIYLKFKDKIKLKVINFICGAILGIFNFGNILFYLKAHQAMSDNPSTVFAAMNIGVILLGSTIGLLVFREKFSKMNYIGLTLAVIAIIFITISKIYAV